MSSNCCSVTKQVSEDPRNDVRERYGEIALGGGSCCGPDNTKHSSDIGYSADDLSDVPDSADLGLGCGNPNAIAAIQPGETVVDLGSGAGMDVFVAAPRVGPTGKVIGVDMTPEMIALARKNAEATGFADRVEFRQGVIEDLPVDSDSADAVISNCVINLSPDKPAVFSEAFRVLKPGGRLAVSDILLTQPLPEWLRENAAAYVACVSGAITVDEYLGAITEAGFVDISFDRTPAAGLLETTGDDLKALADALPQALRDQIAETVWSYKITATKPAAKA